MKLKLITDNPEMMWDKKVRDWVTVFNKIGLDLEIETTGTGTVGDGNEIICGRRIGTEGRHIICGRRV